MRAILSILLILTYSLNVHCKQTHLDATKKEISDDLTPLKLQSICTLDNKVLETSGLIYFDNFFWTINDSGNPNILYKLDSKTGAVISEIRINNSENVDWEELTQDQDYIYIADIGDNSGVRDEKQIYRVQKSDLLKVKEGGSVNSEKISFTYPQIDNKESRFDAEALISYNGSLHLFTKDFFETNHFIIPSQPGRTTAKFVEKFNSNGQVTGAAIDSVHHSIIMVGYLGFGQRLFWEFKDIQKDTFFTGSVRFFSLGSLEETGQLEAVCFTAEKKVYLTNEQFGGLKQQLWNLQYPLQ